jgi:peroxiredoxin Q/BCP
MVMKLRKALLVGALALLPLVVFAKVEVGQPAPDFTLTSQDGNQVSLSQFKGHWVVLYFYPKDFTSGCTMEAHKFQDDQDKYKALDAAIVGVSVDTPDSHKQFCTKEGLTFKLLADPTGKVPTEYDSVMDYQGTKLAARHTFLIDPSGRVVKSYMDVNPKNHSEQVLADLKTLAKK